LGKEGNVFRKFGGGNLQTLSFPSIREDLINFYNEHYSSNIMSLVLYSKNSLSEMEKMVEEKFREVPNKNLIHRVYPEKPFD
jgi:insulysin